MEESHGKRNNSNSKKRNIKELNSGDAVIPGESLWKGRERGKKQKFAFGNYDRYYGYRIYSALSEDPRLVHFRREWFEGKDCLDIGCNEGYVTLNIAHQFCVSSMLGIDIDNMLVDKGRFNLQKMAKSLLNGDEGFTKNEGIESSQDGDESKDDVPLAPCMKQEEATLTGEQLLKRVRFSQANFLDRGIQKKSYDVILCLSVVKWIQLNWGDEGLKKLFGAVYASLRDGGMFILEPQPWKSYKNNRSSSPAAQENFQKIQIKPDKFAEVLLNDVGFHSYEKLTDGIHGSTKGFDRPIFVFHKK